MKKYQNNLSKAQEELLKSLLSGIENDMRWSLVINMPGNGKNSLIRSFLDCINNDHKNINLLSVNCTSQTQVENFINEIKIQKEKNNVVVILVNETFDDISDVIPEIYKLHLKFEKNLFTVIAGPIGNFLTSIKESHKLSVKNRMIIPLMSYDDAKKFMKLFLDRMERTLSEKECDFIYSISRGHFGLMKYLVEIFSNKKYSEDLDQLISIPEIDMWMTKIVKDLPESEWTRILDKQLDSIEQEYYYRLGHIDNDGSIFIPLLSQYLRKNKSKFNAGAVYKNQEMNLSYREINLFDYLLNHKGNIVTRDEACKVLWGEEWVDEYSDWALSQVILNIRKELKAKNLNILIKTVKGKGFVVV